MWITVAGEDDRVARHSRRVYSQGMELAKTPLYDTHKSLGAKFAPFAGYDMPLNYRAGALAEHRAVRESAGLFDTSHMGRFFLPARDPSAAGPGAEEVLDFLVSSDVAGMGDWDARYGLLCAEDGGIIDDVFVYRLSDEWMLVVNAANRAGDLSHFHRNGAAVVDRTDETAMLALQGPKALTILALAAGRAPGDLESVPRFTAATLELAGVSVTAGRTGYTGEDGMELYLPAAAAEAVWDALFVAARNNSIHLLPCGLAARDSLRFEAGFALYGHEIDRHTTPVEARLSWACHFDRPFLGSAAILRRKEEGPARKLVTFTMVEKSVPRAGCRVLDLKGVPVGEVVSGMYAPTVDEYSGNAYVLSDIARTNAEIGVEIRNTAKRAVVVKRPLYTPAYR